MNSLSSQSMCLVPTVYQAWSLIKSTFEGTNELSAHLANFVGRRNLFDSPVGRYKMKWNIIENDRSVTNTESQ